MALATQRRVARAGKLNNALGADTWREENGAVSHYVHPAAICESDAVGTGTRIWAFAHILAGARIGADCNICDGVFVENDVVIGDRVTVKCGVQLWDGLRIADDVFIGPNATFTNDEFPRSKAHPAEFRTTRIDRGASLGANCTILPGLTVGENCLVGAGSVVTSEVPPNAIVRGNPARIVGYVDSHLTARLSVERVEWSGSDNEVTLPVPGVRLVRLPTFIDLRGTLSVAELTDVVPFDVRRAFFVYDVPSSEVRGEHAHRECHQLLMMAHGSCSVVVDDGSRRAEVVLDSPSHALHIPPMIWAVQYKHSPHAVLLVLASRPYESHDYIREYSVFRELVG
jgi:UDP-2-acetamido-3-amino-2,3-dideoxy-glucuronate N-acetyltransferase